LISILNEHVFVIVVNIMLNHVESKQLQI